MSFLSFWENYPLLNANVFIQNEVKKCRYFKACDLVYFPISYDATFGPEAGIKSYFLHHELQHARNLYFTISGRVLNDLQAVYILTASGALYLNDEKFEENRKILNNIWKTIEAYTTSLTGVLEPVADVAGFLASAKHCQLIRDTLREELKNKNYSETFEKLLEYDKRIIELYERGYISPQKSYRLIYLPILYSLMHDWHYDVDTLTKPDIIKYLGFQNFGSSPKKRFDYALEVLLELKGRRFIDLDVSEICNIICESSLDQDFTTFKNKTFFWIDQFNSDSKEFLSFFESPPSIVTKYPTPFPTYEDKQTGMGVTHCSMMDFAFVQYNPVDVPCRIEDVIDIIFPLNKYPFASISNDSSGRAVLLFDLNKSCNQRFQNYFEMLWKMLIHNLFFTCLGYTIMKGEDSCPLEGILNFERPCIECYFQTVCKKVNLGSNI